MKAWTITLALTLLAALPGQGSAQAVRGILVDAAESAVAGATATLFDAEGDEATKTVTAGDGTFLLPVDDRGGYWVRVEAPGHLTVESRPFFVGRGDTIAVRLETRAHVTQLEGVTVQASTRQNRNYAAFLERRGFGWGRYMSPDELERLDPIDIAHVLVGMGPGLSIAPEGYVTMRSRQGQVCDPLYFVDGSRVSLDYFDQLPTAAIRAAEAYTDPNTIPPQLTGAFAQCGAIAVWTDAGLGL